jgi:excisionase family DNA binding protein
VDGDAFGERSRDARAEAARHLQALAEKITEAEARLREAHAEMAGALNDAREVGLTWAEVASAAGLGSPQNAWFRAQRGRRPEDQAAAFRWRAEHGRAPRPPVDPAPGISVTQAAERYGVSRQTIYEWLKSGRVQGAKDARGRTRVLPEDS